MHFFVISEGSSMKLFFFNNQRECYILCSVVYVDTKYNFIVFVQIGTICLYYFLKEYFLKQVTVEWLG